jgi:hypothetical protein
VAATILYRAQQAWADLTDDVQVALIGGRSVMWVSLSGSAQVIVLWDGVAVRFRHAGPEATLVGDGLPLLIEQPFFATSCGLGDGSGYRSTPALLVATFETTDDIDTLVDEARQVRAQLVADGYDPTDRAPGHPDWPCLALHCPHSPG